MSRSVWALIDQETTHKIIENTEPNAKQWLFTLMQKLSHDQFILMAVTLWSIWHSRRKSIHEFIFQSPQATHGFIGRFIADLDIVRNKEKGPAASATLPRQIQRRPKKPPVGFCKIHVDAGVVTRKGGSAVAVCRDDGGNYMGSSALMVEGVVDPATLEAIACREALALAQDLGIQNFVVSSDCLQVVSDMNKNAHGTYGTIIIEINLRASTYHCIFSFGSRAVNYEAHNLVVLKTRAKNSNPKGASKVQVATFGLVYPMTRDVSHTMWTLRMNKLGFTPKKTDSPTLQPSLRS